MQTEQSLVIVRPYNSSRSLVEALDEVAAVDANLLQGLHGWRDVVDAIETAKAQDNAKSDRSKIRGRLRKSGPEIALLESLAGMIPDQDGLGVLRGGLTTLFKMVSLRIETRAMILEAFESIPETLIEAVQASMRFPDASDLLEAVRRLYHTLVEKVATLIEVLLRSHPNRNKVVRFLRHLPGREVEVVQSCLDEVSRAADRVSRCSTAALERAVGEIRQEQHNISESMRGVKSGMDGIQAAIANGVTRLESQWRETDAGTHIRTVAESSRKMLEAANQILKLGWHQQQYLGSVRQQQAALPWVQAAIVATPRLMETAASSGWVSSPVSPSRVSIDGLLQELDVPEAAAAGALARVMQRSCHPRLDAGGRGSRLVTMTRFRDWLGAPWWASDLVLVDGHCGDVAADNVSAMSAICAFLIGVLMDGEGDSSQDRPAAIVLHHFCGQHRTQRDSLRGPGGLIRSLVHQLLVQTTDVEICTPGPQPSLDFIDDELLDGVGEHDIPSLCRVFSELVVRLDASRPVFCIIDGVSEIETVLDGWQEETCLIGNALLSMVEDGHRSGPGLRVLLTSSNRSGELADLVIPSDRRVSLLAGNARGRRSYPWQLEKGLRDLLMTGEAGKHDVGADGF
ncbi:hypothetical protein N657DRAFT_675165 [Parathielavia appendiculata]|uniref:Nephrocystin 3-like N-terminal domain-containing protein n=1 Tax=Parathielavia appendiculata TaxID=2587402 RepID=A0AAN6TR39_9PEZI|nr:hypothetical protein N657DRAFT_675165 [Parathielavia appendiculata]